MAGATSSDSISAPSRSVRRAVPRNRIRIVVSPPGDIRVGAAVEHVVEHTARRHGRRAIRAEVSRGAIVL